MYNANPFSPLPPRRPSWWERLLKLQVVLHTLTVAIGSASAMPHSESQIINITDFGALPNDDIEDTNAIQAAIDKAPDGSTLYFPQGVYISHSLHLRGRRGLALVGEGAKKTVLKRPGDAPADARIATIDGCQDMIVTQLGFDVHGVSRYGGFMVLSSTHTTFSHNRFFDSNKQPIGFEDRYSIVFGYGTRPHEGVVVSQNHIEDLQLEVDNARHVRITGNTVIRPIKTAGIGTFTIEDYGLAEDFEISGNSIIDPVLNAGAITVHLDPPQSNHAVFRNIRIRDNVIVYSAALKTATDQFWDAHEGRTWPPAIQIGTGDNSEVTQGNVFENIRIENNTIWVDPSLGSIRFGIILANVSDKSGFVFRNLAVLNNHIFYHGKEDFLNIGFGEVSLAPGLRQQGNVVRRLWNSSGPGETSE